VAVVNGDDTAQSSADEWITVADVFGVVFDANRDFRATLLRFLTIINLQ
jgi:hypothetical protein